MNLQEQFQLLLQELEVEVAAENDLVHHDAVHTFDDALVLDGQREQDR